MADLYDELPGLAVALSWDPHPLDPNEAPELDAQALRALAEAWLVYHQTFWSFDELHRILDDEGPDATWPIVLALIARGSKRALGAIGAGILEDLLERHGDVIIERVEECAAANPRFRYCLSHVWLDDTSSVSARVVRARGDEPERG